MKRYLTGVLLGLAVLLGAATAYAEPTEIVVRVLSKDAKFVGSSMGGVQVLLRDAETGEILAKGVTAGGTGDTKRLMNDDAGRRALLSDDSAAKFVATIDLQEPRLIEADIFGPLAQPQAAHRALASQWVVPGRHLNGGDGWVIELPGFAVDILSPPAHIKLAPDTGQVSVEANVTMMCGCPIEPEGIWDANKYEVKALVKRDGKKVSTVDMGYAGQTSQFSGTIPVDAPGVYDVTVYAYDPQNGNTGVDRTTFIVN